MTDLLRKAFREAEKLAPAEQDRLASFILADLESERAWDERFLRSQDLLARLADEALEDDDAGRRGSGRLGRLGRRGR